MDLKADASASPARPAVGQPLRLSATVERPKKGPLSVWFRHGGVEHRLSETSAHVDAGGTVTAVHEVDHFSEESAGEYRVWASDGTTEAPVGKALVVPPPEPTEPGTPATPDDPTVGAVELRNLVWDPNFAASTGAAAVLLLIAVAVICGVGAAHLISPRSSAVDTVGVVAYVGTFLGSLLLIASAWLLALETRGRADREAGDSVRMFAQLGGPIGGDALVSLTTAIGKLRGAIALAVVGGLLLGAMAWISKDVAVATVATTSTTTSTTTTSEAPANAGSEGTSEPASSGSTAGGDS